MNIFALPALIACPICFCTRPSVGADNLVVHILEEHPYSWQAEAISLAKRTSA